MGPGSHCFAYGWQFLLAEIIGGLVLIVISSILIKLTYPRAWFEAAGERVEESAGGEEESFDWRKCIKSREGWERLGNRFLMDWEMVWKEILISFTIAGLVAVLVPQEWWAAIFLVNYKDVLPAWLIALENAMLAPFVAAATFIGSIGNIPLAIVLNANGVLFAGIMGFTYSDLMVPPLVAVNAKYYGWRIALYIAIVMYGSILLTALLLSGTFTLLDIVPKSGRAIEETTRFAIDYTFWLNLLFLGIAGLLIWLGISFRKKHGGHMDHEMEGDGPLKRLAAAIAALLVLGGATLAAFA